MTSTHEPSRTTARGPIGAVANAGGLLRHGYRFWELMRERAGTEVVQTRLLHEHVTAVRGARAAEFFYETAETERSSALPKSLVGALFGRGPVHMLDGSGHLHRKSMFNDILDEHASVTACAAVAQRWDDRAPRWTGRVDLFEQVAEILLDAACEWVGLPGAGSESASRTRDMLAMVDGFGAPAPRQLKARAARKRTESWVESAVRGTRDGGRHGTPLAVVSARRDQQGDLLDVHTAAVEVINLVRPLVAVSWLASGVTLAFDSWPTWRQRVREESVSVMEVAQEVRRTYPFVPFLATRAIQDLSFDGVTIPAGTLIVLDTWGTNHDPRSWRDPDEFDPFRYRTTPVTPYNLVPQGGGDRHRGHRCPGEDMTLAVLMTLVTRLAELPVAVVGPRPGLRRMPPKPHLWVDVGR